MLEIIGKICGCILIATITFALVALILTYVAGLIDRKNRK